MTAEDVCACKKTPRQPSGYFSIGHSITACIPDTLTAEALDRNERLARQRVLREAAAYFLKLNHKSFRYGSWAAKILDRLANNEVASLERVYYEQCKHERWAKDGRSVEYCLGDAKHPGEHRFVTSSGAGAR